MSCIYSSSGLAVLPAMIAANPPTIKQHDSTVSAGRSDPWYMLENAERCLDLLEKLPLVKAARPAAARPPQPPTPGKKI
jgi:hypothetical protein